MSRDYSSNTYTQQRRNRAVSAGFKSNPTHPLGAQDLLLQAVSGNFPIYSANGANLSVEVPCGCGGGVINDAPTGDIPEKDMRNENYTYRMDPFQYQAEFFSGMTDFVDANIDGGDKDPTERLNASEWHNFGDDVFDDWGYFYIYDPNAGMYFFPILTPQNQDDGIMSTQAFQAFGRSFTMIHGWAAQGIFKFDITVADTLPFRFGMYGNMGSDGDQEIYSLTYPTTINGSSQTIYYHHDKQQGSDTEILYSYFIPKNLAENNSQTYIVDYSSDNMSMKSKEVTQGILVYFSNVVDTKEWVANDVNATL